jgi:MFS family permease
VTAYSPTLLAQAGYSDIKQNGLAGGINTIGIIGTIISAQIIDRLGRRVCLMGGAAVLFAVNLIVSPLEIPRSPFTSLTIPRRELFMRVH